MQKTSFPSESFSNQASLLARLLPTPLPSLINKWLLKGFVCLTVAGAAPDSHRTSLLSRVTPDTVFEKFAFQNKIFLYYHK